MYLAVNISLSQRQQVSAVSVLYRMAWAAFGKTQAHAEQLKANLGNKTKVMGIVVRRIEA